MAILFNDNGSLHLAFDNKEMLLIDMNSLLT